jgi:hypothetical protein
VRDQLAAEVAKEPQNFGSIEGRPGILTLDAMCRLGTAPENSMLVRFTPASRPPRGPGRLRPRRNGTLSGPKQPCFEALFGLPRPAPQP